MQRSLSLAATAAVFGLVLTGATQAQCTYSWPSSFGSGCDGLVNAVASDSCGDLVAGGGFVNAGGVAVNYVGRWDGSAWNAMGTGMDGPVNALVRMPNGDVVAGGSFLNSGGVATNCIARWNGSSWSALAAGVDALDPFGSSVRSMVVLGNGDLIVGGLFSTVSGVAATNIARWDGSNWSAVGAGTNGQVRDLTVMPNGDIVAVGSFSMAGGVGANNVARWDGSNWSALGSGIGLFGANTVTGLQNGNVLVGGAFGTAGGLPAQFIAQWDGAAWSAIGAGANGPVSVLETLANGDVMVGGAFTSIGGVAANRIALWDTATFSALGSGVDGSVACAGRMADGKIAVGGAMANAGGSAASRIAQVESSCGSATAVIGTGCTGSGGLNELFAVTPPTIGGTFTAKGTGMPAAAFVMVVTGFSQVAIPLAPILPPFALPGCTLYSSGEDIGVVLPIGGQASSAIALPNNPTLIGSPLYQQYVPIEVDALLLFQEITSTNAIELVIGAF